MAGATRPDPSRILGLLERGDRRAAESELAAAFAAGAPSPGDPAAFRFCHGLHLLLARAGGRAVPGEVVAGPPPGSDAEPSDQERWEAGLAAVRAMLEASAALTEGRVGKLVAATRAAAGRLPRPMPWLEFRLASLFQAAFRFDGDLALYHEALEACRRVSDLVAYPYLAVQARALMANVHMLRGEYHKALDLCDAALALADSAGLAETATPAMAHQFRGYVLLEWNRVDEARDALDRAWNLSGPEGRGVRSGVARVMAHLAASAGRPEEAERWLAGLEEVMSEPMTLRNREWFTAVQVRHGLGRGDLRKVEEWLRTYDYHLIASPAASDADILSRLHELDHVLSMLELTGQWSVIHEIAPRVRRAAAGRRAWFEARAAAADAVALEGLGRATEAAEAWEDAIRAGNVGSFVRVYVEGGETRRALVERMARSPEASPRARTLADALSEAASPTLTSKQRQVLALVGKGRSNKAIALELGVSLSTVKTHLQDVYRRLGVSSRTHALAEARRRSLVDG